MGAEDEFSPPRPSLYARGCAGAEVAPAMDMTWVSKVQEHGMAMPRSNTEIGLVLPVELCSFWAELDPLLKGCP